MNREEIPRNRGKAFFRVFGWHMSSMAAALGVPRISSEELTQWRRDLDISAKRELENISQEQDPVLYWENLLAFGIRLEHSGDIQAAAKVYSAILQVSAKPTDAEIANANRRVLGIPNDLLHRAQERLDALLGCGAVGPRAEVLLRQLAQQATDPRTIAPMFAGAAVSSLVRASVLGRLLASEVSWWTRGLGARWSAASLAFMVEVPVFAVSSRALTGGQSGIERDLLSAGLTLGAMKSFAWIGHGATRLSSVLLPQAAMFFGLLAAHRLEEGLGLRPRVDDATSATDALAALFSLGVGASLGKSLLGRGFARFETELNLRAESAAPAPPRFSFRLPASMEPQRAAVGPKWTYSGTSFASRIPFENVWRWLENHLNPQETDPTDAAETDLVKQQERSLKVIRKSFPRLSKFLDRSPWTLEQKWELLKAAIPDTNHDPSEIFHSLPPLLNKMGEAGWGHEQQVQLLQLLARLGNFPVLPHKHLPSVFVAMRLNAWGARQEFDLLYSTLERGGAHADRVAGNLAIAMRAMRGNDWDYRQQFEALELFINFCGAKIGGALSRLPETFNLLREYGWNYAQQVRLITLLGERAPDELRLSWMMEEYLPVAVGIMKQYGWDAAAQSRLLGKMLEHAQGQAATALEFFPGLVHTMQSFAWPPVYAYESLLELFENSGSRGGMMISMTPLLLRMMQAKGLSLLTQRGVLAELALQADRTNEFALMQFALRLLNKPLHWKPN